MTDLAHDRLAQLCEELKIHGVADGYAALAAAAAEQGQSFTDYLEAVLHAERDFRRAWSAATMVRMAGFPAVKTLESCDFKFATSAPGRQIEAAQRHGRMSEVFRNLARYSLLIVDEIGSLPPRIKP